jgi:hypothetical protein
MTNWLLENVGPATAEKILLSKGWVAFGIAEESTVDDLLQMLIHVVFEGDSESVVAVRKAFSERLAEENKERAADHAAVMARMDENIACTQAETARARREHEEASARTRREHEELLVREQEETALLKAELENARLEQEARREKNKEIDAALAALVGGPQRPSGSSGSSTPSSSKSNSPPATLFFAGAKQPSTGSSPVDDGLALPQVKGSPVPGMIIVVHDA